jgi:hypothetical protein
VPWRLLECGLNSTAAVYLPIRMSFTQCPVCRHVTEFGLYGGILS